MRGPNEMPEPIKDQRVYRWLPEIDSIKVGMIKTLETLKLEGADEDVMYATQMAITHLDRAQKALDWRMREITLDELRDLR
jgi:hypothetical protein